ncbi:hypothetical protein AB3Z07_11215 [Metabacillus halosaccharovorans]|uniref:hypothetical protein n=1 Tax=Metabacillus halosaccharovorans TaxID=930124 RepID=UPI0034CD13EF
MQKRNINRVQDFLENSKYNNEKFRNNPNLSELNNPSKLNINNDFLMNDSVNEYVSKKSISIENRLIQIDNFLKHISVKEKSPEIAFAISLKSKKSSRNWKRVEKNLSTTLKTIFNNTDQNYRVIIAGHKKPDIEELLHEKVTWIRVKFAPPKSPKGFFWDKIRKRKVIGTYLRKIGYSGYFMPVDADDWIHYKFVEYIRSCPISDAYIFNKGFMVNIFKKELWMRSRFYGGCGTSQVFYFRNEEFPLTTKKTDIRKSNFRVVIKHHGRVLKHLRNMKKNYSLVNIPLLTWVLAHGDNNTMILKKKNNDVSAKNYNTEGVELSEWFYGYFKTK